MTFEYNGTAVEVVDEESHHGEEMKRIEGDDIDGWVFVEDLDEVEAAA